MSWITKNWYIILIIAAILVWLVIDPSVEADNQVVIEHPKENVETLLKKEESVLIEYKIDIKGEVKSPGVYKVREDDRVEDAIQLAGGFTDNASRHTINLAERVYDEMVIYIPTIDEEGEEMQQEQAIENEDQKVKVNIASMEEIQTIPGIGEVKATAIIEYRETYGRFEKLEDLTKVSGIGQKTVEQMEEYVRIP
ncbi:helix-hairpin-helix domain-containing protein [Gracilibacillus sp. HCP3S3_G5_1]|uniref:helix-hairpin-helix domain-containing protein n=1 Tax=unclassified Gracilibacillus TaxID=2625209 RepID=UPI003F8AEFB8